MFSTIFNLFNMFMFIIWFLVLFLPRSIPTRRLLNSTRLWIVLGNFYFILLLLYGWEIDWIALLNPTYINVIRTFTTGPLGAFVWFHMQIFNLFIARWMIMNGLKKKILLFPFLLLTIFTGPFALALYLVFIHRKKELEDSGTPSATNHDQ